jgi:hydroxypyruvate isomerase
MTALRFDVNLSILFTELPLLERPAAAAAAGFDAVELWWPFDGPVPADAEVDALIRALTDAGVRLVGLNFDAGNMAGGDRGLLSSRSTSQRFRDNIEVTVGLAERLGCRTLNALYGNTADDTDQDLALENLALAAKAAQRTGATVVIEALNSIESPRYPIDSSAKAYEVIDLVPGTAFLADFYHLARMGEDVPALIRGSAERFGHVQIADTPGRGQPGTGELDFAEIFRLLADSPYDGHVGLEYKPVGASENSFGWLEGLQ